MLKSCSWADTKSNVRSKDETKVEGKKSKITVKSSIIADTKAG